jgi:hypothetical protein
MSTTYRVTLLQLNADATALAAAGDKVELGQIPAEEIYRLAGNLMKLDVSAKIKVEPGILVHRDDKGWRIAVHHGRLCMHKSTSLFDEYWTVENPEGLAQLPPFSLNSTAPAPKAARRQAASAKGHRILRTVGEVAGLFVVALGLIIIGFKFGLPQRRLSDLPPDLVLVTADSDRASVFTAVAGSYATGKKPGDRVVTITADGHVTFSRIGKDGKPTASQGEEQARAARKGTQAVILTSLGTIAEAPPDAVSVGNSVVSYSWRKLMTN